MSGALTYLLIFATAFVLAYKVYKGYTKLYADSMQERCDEWLAWGTEMKEFSESDSEE